MSDAQQSRWLKPVNKLMIGLQRLGIPTGPPMVLTVTGRKTGRPRATPITPFEVRNQLYGVPGDPGADWVRNARAAGVGTLSRGRKTFRVNIIELSAADARAVLRAYPAKVPLGVRLAKRAGRVREGSPDEFESLAGVLPVFRFKPVATEG